jgi:BON domain-containing protein
MVPDRLFERPEKRYAEDETAPRVAVRRHRGKYLDGEIIVRLNGQWRRDGEVARAVVSRLQANGLVPEGTVWVAVREGWVTLKGQVDWEHQRMAAAAAARGLTGVRGVINSLDVTPYPPKESVSELAASRVKAGQASPE